MTRKSVSAPAHPEVVRLQQIEEARERIAPYLVRTPTVKLQPDPQLQPLYFKLELLQVTGSFKIRGVLNKLSQLGPQQRDPGVIGVSSGNHAQSLAYGATLFGIPSTIVMPAWSDPGKIAQTRAYGGEVVLTDDNLLEVLEEIRTDLGLTLVHPFDDREVIAGAGSLGLEILEDVVEPDLVVVSIGGGGLISGVAAAIKQRSPSTRIIGVEPLGADVMTRSLEAGRPVTLDKLDTVADGLAAPFAGVHTLRHVQEFVDEVVRISDKEILEALRWLLDKCKLMSEPAASAALAPLLTGAVQVKPGQKAVCIVCGGNLSQSRLREILTSD